MRHEFGEYMKIELSLNSEGQFGINKNLTVTLPIDSNWMELMKEFLYLLRAHGYNPPDNEKILEAIDNIDHKVVEDEIS